MVTKEQLLEALDYTTRNGLTAFVLIIPVDGELVEQSALTESAIEARVKKAAADELMNCLYTFR